MTARLKLGRLAWMSATCLGLGLWSNSGHGQGYEARVLPSTVQEEIKKVTGVEVDYVVAVTADGEFLLAPSDPENLDAPSVLDLGMLPVTIRDSSEVIIGIGHIRFVGSNCHIEMQGGSPKLVPNTPECREKLGLS